MNRVGGDVEVFRCYINDGTELDFPSDFLICQLRTGTALPAKDLGARFLPENALFRAIRLFLDRDLDVVTMRWTRRCFH